MSEVLRTAPIIVDATVVTIDRETGAVELAVHHEFRGTGAKKLVLTKVHLTCVGGAPGHYGMGIGERYVWVLHAPDSLYEAGTFFQVTCEDGGKGWKVQYLGHPKAGAEVNGGISREKFAELCVPVEKGSE